MELKNKTAVILGFGVSGQGSARFLINHGANVIVYDENHKDKFDPDIFSVFENSPNIRFELANKNFKLDESVDMLVVSPGVKPGNWLVQEAREMGAEVHNDLTIFLEVWNNRGTVIGVTGSNGKSTIVTLLHEVLAKMGQDVRLGGNIGLSPLDFIDESKDNTIAVLEISNYQAEYFTEKHFVDIAIFTNISDNHLDRHGGSVDEYAKAKLNIIKNGHTKVVLNIDDGGIVKYVRPFIDDKYTFPVSLETNCEEALSDGVYSGGNGELVVKNNDILKTVFDDTDNRRLFGLHNLYNIACVFGVLDLLQIDYSKAGDVIRDFKGLDHRIQYIGDFSGVTFVNDSKSTSPDATKKAIDAVSDGKNIILISGGDSKDVSYKSLSDYFIKFIKHLIILPGSAKSELLSIASDTDVGFSNVENMEDAVRVAKNFSEEGDIVLLSPGTSSLNQFKGFDDRGDQFVKYVGQLS